jgi:hypothetical protein
LILHGRPLPVVASRLLALAGRALRASAAPRLALSFASKVIDFVGVNVKDDLAPARILVLDDQLCA